MPDVTAEGFLHIIFDTFFGESLFFLLFVCDVIFRTGGYCRGLLKNGQSRQFKANTGLHVYFINQNKPFTPKRSMKCYILGPFVYMRSNTLTLKETNPLYSHCLISEPGFSFVEGGSLMVGLKFLDTAPTQSPSPF